MKKKTWRRELTYILLAADTVEKLVHCRTSFELAAELKFHIRTKAASELYTHEVRRRAK